MGSFRASKVLGLLPKLKGEVNFYDWTGDVQLVLLGHGLEQYLKPNTDPVSLDATVDIEGSDDIRFFPLRLTYRHCVNLTFVNPQS